MVTARTSLFTFAALVAITATLPAQTDRLSGTERFTSNGITVITSPADNDLISVVVGLDGGVASGDIDNPALSEVAGAVIAASGSRSVSKDSLRTFLARTSTRLSGNGDLRGMTYTMTTPRENFDEAWKVLATLITEPAIDPVEFRNIVQRRSAGERERTFRPETQAFTLADSLARLSDPILRHRVQAADIDAITIPAIESYARRVAERSRMLIVVVGRVSRQTVTDHLAPLASLPAGTYKAPTLAHLRALEKPQVIVTDQTKTPTTYVSAAFSGPNMDDPSYWPMVIGMRHLRDVLFEEVRTKRNLSYAPSGYLSTQLGVGVGFISVSSTLPDSSIHVMYRELEKMRRGEFTAEDLEDSKQAYLTNYYMGQMTNAGRASGLYNAERNAGGWKNAFSYDAINAVNKSAVQAAFQTYARNLAVGIVGPARQITQESYRFEE